MTDTEPATIRPADLRTWDGGILYCKNMSSMKISFDDGRGTVATIPQRGAEDSIQVLPLPMAQNPGFQKLWRRGQVVVSTDPAIEEELYLAEQRVTAARQRDEDEFSAIVEKPAADRDLVQAECLHCKKVIFVNAKEYEENAVPRLCEDHKDLAAMFASEITIDPTTGAESTKWVAVSIKPKEKAPSVKKKT